jgi:hypothetical protein
MITNRFQFPVKRNQVGFLIDYVRQYPGCEKIHEAYNFQRRECPGIDLIDKIQSIILVNFKLLVASLLTDAQVALMHAEETAQTSYAPHS